MSAAALSLNKQYDCKLVQKLKGKGDVRLPSLSLNLPTFDEDTIGCGGLADGRIYEIYGPESAGKTTLALHIIACAQKAGGLAAFIDAEHALMLKHAQNMGVDVDELIISQPDYGEQAIEVALALAETGAIRVVVIDSVSALVPKAELEGDMTDASMGMQARLMSKAMRKLIGVCNRTGTIVIFINQIREKIGVMFGNPETTTGGRALKFFASARFEVRRVSKSDGGEILDEQKRHIGHHMRIKNVKNKVGNPYRETSVALLYELGLDTKADTVEYAIEHGIVTEPSKGFFVAPGGSEKVRRDALTTEPFYENVVTAVKKQIESKG